MSYTNTGKVWSPKQFGEYLKTVKRPSFAKRVCLHHTASPSLAMRPKGFLAQHLENLRHYYQNQMGWSAGPHLFTDEDQIWGLSPLTSRGVHSVGWNSSSIGIEALGNYDVEDPKNGRGLEVWKTTMAATKELLKWLDLPMNNDTVVFHREDGKTKKTCPGKLIDKNWLFSLAENCLCECKPVENERVIATVSEFLIGRGFSYKDIAANLKNRGGKMFWKNHWLEGAYYDKTQQATVAPVSEILEAIA